MVSLQAVVMAVLNSFEMRMYISEQEFPEKETIILSETS